MTDLIKVEQRYYTPEEEQAEFDAALAQYSKDHDYGEFMRRVQKLPADPEFVKDCVDYFGSEELLHIKPFVNFANYEAKYGAL